MLTLAHGSTENLWKFHAICVDVVDTLCVINFLQVFFFPLGYYQQSPGFRDITL